MPASVATNLAHVRVAIQQSATRAGRDPGLIKIVAVTKTLPIQRVREAIEAGLGALGENRVQEALPKIEAIGVGQADWHLIGHLQSNKVKFVEGHFLMVQSVDSVDLIRAMDRRLESPIDVLIEVNVGEEPQKTGAAPSDLAGIVQAAQASAQLRLQGLMTIAPLSTDPEAARPVFRRLHRLRAEMAERFGISLPELSMGMTDDYAIAVEEGATMLRLGRALFGPR
ncbi:MAG TPA: YggS family pyridoxal phosphate-dependent enzyme [Candidatus Dormibacteraeota bacterium]|jgi:pyridoxal phosphate enzyme (YggS family)